jgi:hypothetical protein
MIGETVTGRLGSRHAWLAWMMIGALMVACNFAADGNHLLILSLAPFAVGFAVLMTRREPLIFRFDDEGIEVISPELEFIPYRSIEALTVGYEEGRQRSIAVLHRNGALNIPAGIDEESRRVYRFLRSEMPEEPAIGPPPILRPYMRAQDEQFGEERVYAYRSLAAPRFDRGFLGVFVSAALFAVAIVWILIGYADVRYREWRGGGLLGCLGSMTGFVICLVTRRPGASSDGDGGIVIAPVGIAVEQGDLLGKIRWEEITQIDRNQMSYALQLHFLGGVLTLGDSYHRSLRVIYRRMLDYWEGPLEEN